MGEKIREALKLRFDKRLRLEFHGAKITSDAGLSGTGRGTGVNGDGTNLSAGDKRVEECAE